MFGLFKKGLEKTIQKIKEITKRDERVDRDLIEEILIASDVEYDVVEELISKLPQSVTYNKLQPLLLELFTEVENSKNEDEKPFVELIIGVNGAGKTTTIAKLTKLYKNENKKVILGAGDTFRAAAIEQLKKWAEKLDVPIIYTQQGHDPSAIAYDTIASAIAKNYDKVIIDTAGRLHNQVNLSNELKKIVKVCQKAKENSPHRKILIIDGTQGNSAIAQAKAFHDMVGIDGIIITKLDGTSKGGAIFSIARNLKVPILYIGMGEKEDDLIPFEPKEYIDTILDEIFTTKS